MKLSFPTSDSPVQTFFMPLKYRLVVPTIFVFAVTFGMGTLLGVYGARRPAAAALGMCRSRLRRKLRAYGLIQRAENSSNP